LRSLQDCLEQAVLGVQLLGPREGYRPAWGDRSFVRLPSGRGRRRSGANPRAPSAPLAVAGH
jgi:hypothetical protein